MRGNNPFAQQQQQQPSFLSGGNRGGGRNSSRGGYGARGSGRGRNYQTDNTNPFATQGGGTIPGVPSQTSSRGGRGQNPFAADGGSSNNRPPQGTGRGRGGRGRLASNFNPFGAGNAPQHGGGGWAQPNPFNSAPISLSQPPPMQQSFHQPMQQSFHQPMQPSFHQPMQQSFNQPMQSMQTGQVAAVAAPQTVAFGMAAPVRSHFGVSSAPFAPALSAPRAEVTQQALQQVDVAAALSSAKPAQEVDLNLGDDVTDVVETSSRGLQDISAKDKGDAATSDETAAFQKQLLELLNCCPVAEMSEQPPNESSPYALMAEQNAAAQDLRAAGFITGRIPAVPPPC